MLAILVRTVCESLCLCAQLRELLCRVVCDQRVGGREALHLVAEHEAAALVDVVRDDKAGGVSTAAAVLEM